MGRRLKKEGVRVYVVCVENYGGEKDMSVFTTAHVTSLVHQLSLTSFGNAPPAAAYEDDMTGSFIHHTYARRNSPLSHSIIIPDPITSFRPRTVSPLIQAFPLHADPLAF